MSTWRLLTEYLMCQRTAKPAQVQARLRGLVQHAYTNVPYYRDLMTGAGVHPSDFRTMRDFIDGFPPTHTLHYRAVQHEEGPESLLDQRLRVENLSRDNDFLVLKDGQRLYKVTDMIRHFSRGRFDFDLHVVDHIAMQPNGKRKILISRLTCESGGSTPDG